MSAPADVLRLAQDRADARVAKDFATADALRDQIAGRGWVVHDEPGGFSLEPIADENAAGPKEARDVASVLDQEVRFDAALHWVCEGWPDDIDRAMRAFAATSGDRRLQFVIADITGEAQSRWQERADVEVVSLTPDTGWAAARNAGLRRSLAPVVVALDGSVEPHDDVLTPLDEALQEPTLGVCGPFGIVTTDLREFREATEPGPCDAVEGYLMAFRRDVLAEIGGFDEKFKWYRTADIDWSFRVKEAGYACAVVGMSVTKHEHRAWAAATEEERASRSKRNFYRFLDRYRDRWDLVLSGAPTAHDHDDHHEHHHDAPVTLPEGR